MSQGVLTLEQLEEVVAAYLEFDEFVLDVETMPGSTHFADKEARLDIHTNKVFWLSLAGPGRADAIPFGHPIGELIEHEIDGEHFRYNPNNGKLEEHQINPDSGRLKWFRVPEEFTEAPKQLWATDVFRALEPLLFSDRRKIGHNLKFDLKSIAKYYGGRVPPGPYGDTLVAARLINENHFGYKLGDVVWREFRFKYNKKIGKEVDNYPYSVALLYSYLDAKYCWLYWVAAKPQMKKERIRHIFDFEMDLYSAIMDMEMAGVAIDSEVLSGLDVEFSAKMATLQLQIETTYGGPINLNAPLQVADLVYNVLGKTCVAFTKHGQEQVDARALEPFNKNKTVKQLLEYKQLSKLHTAFVTGLLAKRTEEGRVHGGFNQVGTVSGRFSCVSGRTVLSTSRGDFRFDEYLPQWGDEVISHLGRPQQVLRKIFKGYNCMYRVLLSTGAWIECTEDHQFLTPSGWARLGDLAIGDVVSTYVVVKDVHNEREQHSGSSEDVLRRGQADTCRRSDPRGHYLSQRDAHRAAESFSRTTEGRARPAVLTFEDERAQPDEGQIWKGTPQLQGAYFRWSWLSNEEGQWSLRPLPPLGVSAGVEEERVQELRCALHRRGPTEQRFGQSGISDFGRPQGFTSTVAAEIREIVPLGAEGTWDIEVAGDHSYAAQGFLNHNSSNPNLQQIPSRSEQGKRLREVFLAGPGNVLIVSDYSQIELRVLAHFTRDRALRQVYREGISLHKQNATLAFGPDYTTEQYSWAKNAGFCVPMDTQALTRDGWKSYDEITLADEVLGYRDGRLQWTSIQQKVHFKDQQLMRLSTADWEAVTTPQHRWIGDRRRQLGHRGPRYYEETELVSESIGREDRIFLSAPLGASSELPISPDEAALIAWIWGDGSIIRSEFVGAPSQGVGGWKVKFQASIHQSKLIGVEEIENLLRRLGVSFRVLHRQPRHSLDGRELLPMHEWVLDPQYMRELWKRAELDKLTPVQFVTRLGSEHVKAFADAAWFAEGWHAQDGNQVLAQNEGPVLEAFALAIFLSGHYPRFSSNGTQGNAENWNVRFGKPLVTGQRIQKKMLGVEDVWCLVTGTGSWVMRQGNRMMLTGNSAVYGAVAQTMASKYHIPIRIAEQILNTFYGTYKRVNPWKEEVWEQARRRYKKGKQAPYVETILGRKRRLPELVVPGNTKSGRKLRAGAERQAISVTISGSAADLFKVGQMNCYNALQEVSWEGHILMLVHDELVVEVPERYAEEGLELVTMAMEDPINPFTGEPFLAVPVEVEAKIVHRWAEAK